MTAAHMDAVDVPVKKVVKKSAFWPILFCVLLVIPVNFDIGTLRISPFRILLLLLLVPSLFNWLRGKAGKKIAADYFMLLFMVWCVIAIFVVMGGEGGVQPAGMWMIETLGAYFLGRVYIRDEVIFRKVVKVLFFSVLLLLPLAAAESILNRAVALNFFNNFGRTFPIHEMEFRMGLRRAQGVFEHPILFGVFCSSVFSFAFYVLGGAKLRFGSAWRILVSVFATFFSLSTGAFIAIAIQSILIAWDFLMRKAKKKWTILTIIVIFLYVSVDALSNRSPAEVFITYLTFNLGSSYNRVLIWQYGTQQVFLTPWFGTGIPGDWIRPIWMHSGSLDNFWLLMAVRHGLPAAILIMLVCWTMMRRVGKTHLLDPQLLNARKGLLFALIAMSVSLCTVHLWSATYCLFIFLLGSGSWLIEAGVNRPADGKKGRYRDSDDGLQEEVRPA
jgi:O-Antigen ligase